MKLCKLCGESKPLTDFYVNRDMRDGRWTRCKVCVKASQAPYYKENRAARKAYAKRQHRSLKLEVLARYSPSIPPSCACCGESEPMFLALDHIRDNGRQHRREVGSGHNFYRWLKANGFPDDVGLRVLCHNCNMGRVPLGICPHELREVPYQTL